MNESRYNRTRIPISFKYLRMSLISSISPRFYSITSGLLPWVMSQGGVGGEFSEAATYSLLPKKLLYCKLGETVQVFCHLFGIIILILFSHTRNNLKVVKLVLVTKF